MKTYRYKIGDDEVFVSIESGDPGGCVGEFGREMAKFLSEWYDTDVKVSGVRYDEEPIAKSLDKLKDVIDEFADAPTACGCLDMTSRNVIAVDNTGHHEICDKQGEQ